MSVDNDFYDLEDLQLNFDPITGQRKTSWGNLGYWNLSNNASNQACSKTQTYSQACYQLAVQLANMAQLQQLSKDHTVLDTGFGCGDQLWVWCDNYGVNNLYGVNYSSLQTNFALAQLKQAPKKAEIQLLQGDCCDAQAWQTIPKALDRVLALDCVYHFNNKSQYFNLCHQHLVAGGLLVISDLLLLRPIVNPLHRFILTIICKLSHIPLSNLMTQAQYQAFLAQHHFQLSEAKDISKHVFLPFGQWLKSYIKSMKQGSKQETEIARKMSWIKYQGTAAFLKWAYKRNILSYQLLKIEKHPLG